MEFRCPKQECNHFSQLNSLEWLETNGLGGYASSTILDCHTRKYHGLLVSNLNNLPDKYVLLSKLDDVLILPEGVSPLSAHQYRDVILDQAYSSFQEFTYSTHPQTIYQITPNIYLAKEVLLISGEDTILIKYKLIGSKEAKIKVLPLFAYRNFHAVAQENTALNPDIIEQGNNSYKFAPYGGMPECFLAATPAALFTPHPVWYRNFFYKQEQQRGYAATEDLFSPCSIEIPFADNAEAIVACSLNERIKDQDLFEVWNREMQRRKELQRKSNGSALQQALQQAAHSFIQKKPITNCTSVVAGYHWFLEWGRDAMIALPGLTLYSGLERECLAVLREFATHEKDGLIPNFIGDQPENNAYNSVDASLWLIWAVQQYYKKTRDLPNLTTYFWPVLKNIFINYKNGTLHNIKMQDDGLLYAGSKEINLTWMDAVVNHQPVTPRYGLQVEINALWFNAASFIYELAATLHDPIKNEVAQLLPKIRLSFCQTFFAPQLGYLYDFINAEEKNSCLRPNQIFAVSLPYSPLPKKFATQVMDKVQAHLLTPYGLRTLSPQDTGYHGTYAGTQEARDYAYHNGTVWPWLLGHFGEALLKVRSRRYAAEVLKPCLAALEDHLYTGGIGTLAEIFSGDVPHKADGCISQAWSVAEILRLTYILNTGSKS